MHTSSLDLNNELNIYLIGHFSERLILILIQQNMHKKSFLAEKQ